MTAHHRKKFSLMGLPLVLPLVPVSTYGPGYTNRMTRAVFQLESDTVDDPHWVRMRHWNDYDTKSDESVVYEIGEPVHVKGPLPGFFADHVFWIYEFRAKAGGKEYVDEVSLWVHEPDDKMNARVAVHPRELIKLPDMMRIAVEASRRIKT